MWSKCWVAQVLQGLAMEIHDVVSEVQGVVQGINKVRLETCRLEETCDVVQETCEVLK